MYSGPFGYNGAAPPILDRTADNTPSPLLPARAGEQGNVIGLVSVYIYRRRWLLSIGAYSFSQQENERLTANMHLIGIPLINMGGVIIILRNTAGEALNKYTIKPTAK